MNKFNREVKMINEGFFNSVRRAPATIGKVGKLIYGGLTGGLRGFGNVALSQVEEVFIKAEEKLETDSSMSPEMTQEYMEQIEEFLEEIERIKSDNISNDKAYIREVSLFTGRKDVIDLLSNIFKII